MEIQGKVKMISPLREGVSQRTGNAWKRLPFLFEFSESDDMYSQRMTLETDNEAAIANLKEGMEIVVTLKFDTHSWGQNTYNDIRVREIKSLEKKKAETVGENVDELPF